MKYCSTLFYVHTYCVAKLLDAPRISSPDLEKRGMTFMLEPRRTQNYNTHAVSIAVLSAHVYWHMIQIPCLTIEKRVLIHLQSLGWYNQQITRPTASELLSTLSSAPWWSTFQYNYKRLFRIQFPTFKLPRFYIHN